VSIAHTPIVVKVVSVEKDVMLVGRNTFFKLINKGYMREEAMVINTILTTFGAPLFIKHLKDSKWKKFVVLKDK
jgi:hypothetical protein